MRERRGDPIDCLSDLRQSALHRGRNLGVFMVDDAGNFERGLEVQIADAAFALSVPRRRRSTLVAPRFKALRFKIASPRLRPTRRETPVAPF